MRAWIAILLLSAGLSGCAGGNDEVQVTEPPEERPESTVEVRDKPPAEAGSGAIEGIVVDELNLTMGGAHISLTGTGLFTTAADNGTFAFPKVNPGPHLLRVDAAEREGAEVTVDVPAGKTVFVTVVVYLPEDRVGDLRPHRHDHWRGQDTYLLMDAAVDLMPHKQYATTNVFSQTLATAFYAGFLALNTSFPFFIPPLDDGPPIILPGTKEIEVTVDWEVADATNAELGVAFLRPGETTWQALPAKAPGSTWLFPVLPEQTDSGHQEWSFWQFRLHEGQGPAGAGVTVDVHPGQAHIKMVLHKGQVFFEQPHREFWGDNDTIVLMDDTHRVTGGVGARDAPTTMAIPLPEEALVPPGTRLMRIEMDWENPTAPVPRELGLRWRTGEQNPGDTRAFDFKTADAVERGDDFAVYEFELEPDETDQYYQSVSNWLFKVSFPEDEVVGSYAMDSWDVHLKVQVWR